MNFDAIDPGFWHGRRVFLTGHTGFKGSWTALWLSHMGAKVYGFALVPETERGLYVKAQVARTVVDWVGDVRDANALHMALEAAKPEIVLHMAAQPLVRLSYAKRMETYAVNVIGTVNLLDAVNAYGDVRAVIIVTSDKVYRNEGATRPFQEQDPLGGHDPYSNSKACVELLTDCYRLSCFHHSACRLATVRAGNVIGGGDWACDRLVPDAIRAFSAGAVLHLRNPSAIRPWQYVLEPIAGYLMLAQRLVRGGDGAEAWNFGPADPDHVSVRKVVDHLAGLWGKGAAWDTEPGPHLHEAATLRLDCGKARTRLGWAPRTNLQTALRLTAEWYSAERDGKAIRDLSLQQINDFMEWPNA